MKKIILPVSLIFLCFSLSAFKDLSEDYLKIGSKKWALQSATVANESYGSKSKYELDLISDSDDISKAKTFVYFSITSSATTELSEGIYYFSPSNLEERAPFEFNGRVNINGQEIKILDGSFSIHYHKEFTDVHFILKLENGDVAKGIYTGNFTSIDRSSNYNQENHPLKP